MKVLVMPLGGLSSRYPSISRPKWLLNMPNGNLMIQESLKGIDLQKFDDVLFICLEEHVKAYDLETVFKKAFKFNHTVIPINYSESQPDTVRKGLKIYNKECSILIKDCDNTFAISDYSKSNYVCYGIIGKDFNNGDIENKSYIVKNDLDQVENIVEKQVISDSFCVGGYGFDSSTKFIEAVEKLEKISELKSMYVSHVIYDFIAAKTCFDSVRVSNYVDWGTQNEYEKYKKQFSTLFIDIDGVLVKNSAEYFEPYWGTTEALYPNVKYLQDLYTKGLVQIVLTTARTEEFRLVTEKQLAKFCIPYDHIIYGMWHSKRVLINDFAGSNNYRTADAINIKRNGEDLQDYLKGVLN